MFYETLRLNDFSKFLSSGKYRINLIKKDWSCLNKNTIFETLGLS
jgi:hypothetical protein